MRVASRKRNERRRGLILLVILAMLTIMAIVGITFLYVADNSRVQARYFKEADFDRFRGGGGGGNTGGSQPADIDPNELLKWAYGQLIYDVADDASGVRSSMRGHSLARSMYGLNDYTLNMVPFNGTGRLHYQMSLQNLNTDHHRLINYMYFRPYRTGQTPPSTGSFLHDPERMHARTSTASPRGPFTGGHNVDYTYPDLNNMFLAAIQADGTILTPSFHRESNAGRLDQAPGSALWTNQLGKYLTLRPRPTDHDGFPFPLGRYGDVINLRGSQVYDSIWMDLGYPVQTTADGKKFKPLFAFLVLDLDNRINLNVAGNLMGPGGSHASNQGWGVWEVALDQVLNADGNNGAAVEWRNILLGNASTRGRYGRPGEDQVPQGNNRQVPSGRSPHVWAQVDFNGNGGPFGVPGENGVPATSPFPVYPPATYGNGGAEPRGTNNRMERTEHAALFDYFRPGGGFQQVPDPQNPGQFITVREHNDYKFPLTELKTLLYNAYTGVDIATSELGRLCAVNFGNDTPGTGNTPAHYRRRNMVTTLSMDVNRPGLPPWIWNAEDPRYAYVDASPNDGRRLPPRGKESPFPDPVSTRDPSNVPNSLIPSTSDFQRPGGNVNDTSSDWRARLAGVFSRLDLNRTLPQYPNQTTHNAYGITQVADLATGVGQQLTQAVQARQQMAREIYLRLLAVTGVPPITTPPTDANMGSRRWLAQLAVNIVDYIDEDENCTPFQFYPIDARDPMPGPQLGDMGLDANNTTEVVAPYYIVFGNELPLVALNEVVTEYKLPKPNATMPNQAQPFGIKVWVELFNALRANSVDSPTTQQVKDDQPIPLFIETGVGGQGYSAYQIVVANTRTQVDFTNPSSLDRALFPSNANVLGAPHRVRSIVNFTAQSQTVANANVKTIIAPEGYLLVGPKDEPIAADKSPTQQTIKAPRVPGATPWFKTDSMEYQANYHPINGWSMTDNTQPDGPTNDPNNRRNGISVLLRRLANPHLPPNTDPTSALYNPYITIDYIQGIPLNDATNAGAKYAALGKSQTYASHRQLLKTQTTADTSDVSHTFGKINDQTDPATSWQWLAHLDRQLVSPAELLTVSGVRQHELMHRLIDPNTPTRVQTHLVPWFDQDLGGSNPPESHRLWRLFEFLTTKDRGNGIGAHGRIPGRVNINTVWDPEVFRALCSPKAGTPIDDARVNAIWASLIRLRTPTPPQGSGVPLFTGADRPFRSLAVGHLPVTDIQAPRNRNYVPVASGVAPSGTGLNDTFFRSGAPNGNGTTPRLFQVPGRHPTQQYALMAKLLNRITTRSNVFAAWLTVGFFEVKDDSFQPVKLGEEIGKDEGLNIRHRFFAIIDRTELSLFGRSVAGAVTPHLTQIAVGSGVSQTGVPVDVALTSVGGLADPSTTSTSRRNANGTPVQSGIPGQDHLDWTIQKGTYLIVGTGENREVVLVEDVKANNVITAIFQRAHGPLTPITIPGNPGPQPGFDPGLSLYRPVIPYVTTLR